MDGTAQEYSSILEALKAMTEDGETEHQLAPIQAQQQDVGTTSQDVAGLQAQRQTSGTSQAGTGVMAAGTATGNPYLMAAGAALSVVGKASAAKKQRLAQDQINRYKGEVARKDKQVAALNNLSNISQQLRNL